MRIYAAGQPIDIPDNVNDTVDADDFRDAAGIDDTRILVRRSNDGNELIGPHDKLAIKPGDVFADLPQYVRGD